MARPEHDPARDAAFAAARSLCGREARSLLLYGVFLAQPQRDAICAVAAFCRMIADAIAQAGAAATQASCSPGSLDERLSMLSDLLDELYAGRLKLPRPAERSESHRALHAIALTVAQYQIPRQHFIDIAEGCRMGCTVSRYATWGALERYCYHTGGVLGVAGGCILGLTHSEAWRPLGTLGIAMRLTALLRDVHQHRKRGRIHLPLEDMVRFRYGERDLAGEVVNDAFRELMRFEVARGRRLFRQGAEGLCRLGSDGARLSAAAAVVSHAGILNAIERRRYDVFSGRPALTIGQKLARLPLILKLARRRPDEPLPDVFPE